MKLIDQTGMKAFPDLVNVAILPNHFCSSAILVFAWLTHIAHDHIVIVSRDKIVIGKATKFIFSFPYFIQPIFFPAYLFLSRILLNNQQMVRRFGIAGIFHKIIRHHRKAHKICPLKQVFSCRMIRWTVQESICCYESHQTTFSQFVQTFGEKIIVYFTRYFFIGKGFIIYRKISERNIAHHEVISPIILYRCFFKARNMRRCFYRKRTVDGRQH